jgi:hypothetical protein
VPIPGIEPKLIAQLGADYSDRLSTMGLGVWPYVGALVLVELVKTVAPGVRRWERRRPANARTIASITRALALLTATIQAIGISYALEGVAGVVTEPGATFRLTSIITLVGCAAFVIWLTDQITWRGIGSGVWVLLVAQTLIELPYTVAALASWQGDAGLGTVEIMIGGAFALAIFAAVTKLVIADGTGGAAATCLWAVVLGQAVLPPLLAPLSLFVAAEKLGEGTLTFALLAIFVAAFAWLYARSRRRAELAAPGGTYLAVIAAVLAALILANLLLPAIVLQPTPRSSQLIILAVTALSVLTPWWKPKA